ncbi:MAG: nucleotidyltransferase family protein [Bacteroidota bacterium]
MKNYTRHIISYNATLIDGLNAINNITNAILCLFVLDNDKRLVGTLTDGDIRRALIKGLNLNDRIEIVMEKNFQSILIEDITPAQIKKFRNKGIKLLPCVDKDGIIIKMYDLVAKKSILPIDAVLMAGGKGERLRPLTEKTPKPLLNVGNKTIIDHNVNRMLQFGIEHIHVTTNYLAEQIETHFLKEIDGVKINCIKEPKFLGTMGSVKFIKNFHHNTVLVMNSDLFTNIDFEDFYAHHLQHNADISVAAIPYSVSVPYGVLELEESKIKGLREKPTYNYYANGGIYLVNRKLFDLIPEDTFFDATDFIEKLIAENYNVVRFPLVGYWIDIGKHEDYKKAMELVKYI